MEQQQVMPVAVEPEYVVWIAIDWADQKHYWSLKICKGGRTEQGTLENSPEAVEAWVMELSRRFPQGLIAVALEQSRGALVSMLGKYERLHIYPVHPKTLADYRRTWYPSGRKDDPIDADLLLDILTTHRDRLRRLEPDTPLMRSLQLLVENRRKLVDQRTATQNRLQDVLKICFPQVLNLFDDVGSKVAGDLLERWPTLQELQKAKPATILTFLRQHNCRDEERNQQRLQQIREAVAAIEDVAMLDAYRPMVVLWVKEISACREAIREIEKRIEDNYKNQPDRFIFESLPGAGEALEPRLMVALGSNRDRYESAYELQCFSGIAPVKQASGNREWVHFRWACPKFQKQTYHEFAACSIPKCPWAKAYYQQQLANGKTHHMAVRALAFKWMRILFRCWKDRQPYREDVYLASLAKRYLPLAQIGR